MFNIDKKYDVFISYRRGGGGWIARCLYYYLTGRGLNCFLDHREVPNGHVDDAVREGIRDSDYFFPVVAEGTLPVRGTVDWFAWEWDCARELKTADHIIPLVVGTPCDAATLDAFTGTVNRYAADAGGKFERDVDDVIKRCDSLKEKVEKLARRGAVARTKAEKKFRARSEKRLRKMSRMGISLYDHRCKCVRDELEADARQRGLTQLQAKDILEEIDKALEDKRDRRRWFAAHPWAVRFSFLLIVIVFAWCAYELLPPERRAKVDEVLQVAVRGLGWLMEKIDYVCDGTLKELSRSLR